MRKPLAWGAIGGGVDPRCAAARTWPVRVFETGCQDGRPASRRDAATSEEDSKKQRRLSRFRTQIPGDGCTGRVA